MQFRAQHIYGLPYKKINSLLDLDIKSERVYLSRKAIEHIKERHPYEYQICLKNISSIIRNPDYIGQSPGYKDKYELVKIIDQEIILVAMNALANTYGNYPIESAYIIAKSTLKRRLRTKHLKNLQIKTDA